MDLFENAKVNLDSGPNFDAERAFQRMLRAEGYASDNAPIYICGVDEVGRGPLAGPVVAAAVILDEKDIPVGLDDSKKLSAKKRDVLASEIKSKAIAYAVAEVDVETIDRINILEAAMLAMREAVAKLKPTPLGALVDGNRDPNFENIASKTLIKGDARSLSIAAASIIAKVFRDNLMENLGNDYPEYGWGQNAGYGVPKHMAALKLVGVSPHHRTSFKPIRDILDEKNMTNT